MLWGGKQTQKPLCQEETIYNLCGKYTRDPEPLIENPASFIMTFVRIIKPYEVHSVPFPPFIIPCPWLCHAHFKEIAHLKVTDEVFIASSSILST